MSTLIPILISFLGYGSPVDFQHMTEPQLVYDIEVVSNGGECTFCDPNASVDGGVGGGWDDPGVSNDGGVGGGWDDPGVHTGGWDAFGDQP